MYYNIIVARPFDQVFTYESDDQFLEIGQIVIVPFGKAMEVGMVMAADVNKPDYKIKTIETKGWKRVYVCTPNIIAVITKNRQIVANFFR